MIVLPGVWPGAARTSSPGSSGPLASHSAMRSVERRELAGGAGVGADEVRPVALVAAVGGVGEHDAPLAAWPSPRGRSAGG